MSAAGRTEIRSSNDLYVTPPWSIARLVEGYDFVAGATVLDPCAASGVLLSVLHELRPDLKLIAIELREECRPHLQALTDAGVIDGFFIGDFLELAASLPNNGIDYVVTNPPYSLAREFIDQCTRIAARANVQLLRINFLGAQKRRDWTEKCNPGMKVLPNRPSFTGWGGDATEYAWFIYKDPALAGRWGILNLTPKNVIAEWCERARAMFPHLKPERLKKARALPPASVSGDYIPPGASLCGTCKEPQLNTPSGGWSCANGHAGALSLAIGTEVQETAKVQGLG